MNIYLYISRPSDISKKLQLITSKELSVDKSSFFFQIIDVIQIHGIKRLTFYVLQFRDVNMTDGASCKHTQNII